jgi:lysozyme
MSADHIAEKLIKEHEGLRLYPYVCSAGKMTIGYGRNIEDRGISMREAEDMLRTDIRLAQNDAEMFCGSAWCSMSACRRAAIIDMAYNLGLNRLSTFKNLQASLFVRDWKMAAAEMLDSRWAKQVGERATTLARMMSEDTL